MSHLKVLLAVTFVVTQTSYVSADFVFLPSLNNPMAAGTGLSFPVTDDASPTVATFSFSTSGNVALVPEPNTSPITPFHQTPMISSGESGLTNPLHWRIDGGSNPGFVTLNIMFDMPVLDPSFLVGDIDTGAPSDPGGILTDPPYHSLWQDVVIVEASLNMTTIAANIPSLGPEVAQDTGNIYDPNALVLYGENGDVPTHTPNSSSFAITDGNAAISYTGWVDKISITYGSGTAADGIPGYTQDDPAEQFISLSSITTAVPEVSSFISGGVTLLLVGLCSQVRRIRESANG